MAPDLAIECANLTKRFGETAAVDRVTLEVEEGETLALLGPSGCGKTTLLRLIAGFETPDEGSVAIHGRTVVGGGVWVPPDRRQIGFVFQDYALFPHLTVERNVAFGLKGSPRLKQRTAEILELVGLAGDAKRMPHQLSGGMQQRVALARALAPDPDLVLLDEPFSNLDAAIKGQVRRELDRILRAADATAIFVTHDQEEALNLGSMVAVMAEGRIVEVGAPREIYIHPKSRQTAEIVGATNLISGVVENEIVHCPLGDLRLDRPAGPGAVKIMLRPESIEIAPADGDTPRNGSVPATVRDAQFHGNHQHVRVRLGEGSELRVRVGPSRRYRVGDRVWVSVPDPVARLPE